MEGTRRAHAAALWWRGRVVRDHTVELDAHGVITEVRPAQKGDPEPEAGLVVPGFVNAHTHLELSWVQGQVPGGHGFLPWAERLGRLRRAQSPTEAARRAATRAAAEALVARGTVAVSDICNESWPAEELAAAGLEGVVQHERYGMDPARLPELVAEVEAINAAASPGALVQRASPHAPMSTPADLVRAAVASRPGLPPASMHVAEDPDEIAFLATGQGAWAEALDRWGMPWRSWQAPGCSPIAWLHELGVLGPGLLLVHGVLLDDADRAMIAASGSPLCLCPRSNQHITGLLPDVPALLAAGIPLCLGTDGSVSCPDLDVLNEIPVLAKAFPEVDPTRWLQLATSGGADALGLSHLGRIEVGARPGLVCLPGVHHCDELVMRGLAPRRLL